jgi:uncharacterized membrane protein
MNKNIKRGYETAIWGLFLLFNLSAICFALYAFMKAVGIEITRIYLNSSYKYQFITILIMPGVLFIACAYMAIYAAIKIIGRAPGPKMNIRAASLLSAAMLCLTAGGSLYEQTVRLRTLLGPRGALRAVRAVPGTPRIVRERRNLVF